MGRLKHLEQLNHQYMYFDKTISQTQIILVKSCNSTLLLLFCLIHTLLDLRNILYKLQHIRLVQTQSRKTKLWVSLVIISCRYFAKNWIQIVRVVSYFYLKLQLLHMMSHASFTIKNTSFSLLCEYLFRHLKIKSERKSFANLFNVRESYKKARAMLKYRLTH